jgi:antitoxin YefM
MKRVSAAEASARLDELIDTVVANHAPVTITGPTNNAVLVSAQDWEAINETIFLFSIRGMRESILDGSATPIDECATRLNW